MIQMEAQNVSALRDQYAGITMGTICDFFTLTEIIMIFFYPEYMYRSSKTNLFELERIIMTINLLF